MGGKSQPNFGDLAVQQGEANEQVVRGQTYANRPTQYSPFGFTQWSANPYRDPSSGEMVTRWEQTTGLTPALQDILNKQVALQGARTDLAGGLATRMGQEFGQQMDFGGLSPLSETPQAQFTLPEGGIGDPYQTRQAAESAVFNQAMSRLQPQFDSRRQALEIKLRNQGIGPEDAAWQSQFQNLAQAENDARNQALWSASGAGRQEAGQMFGQQLGRSQQMFGQALGANQQNFQQAMQQANYANALRQQQMAEAMQQRGFSLNEINALLSGQQVGMPQMPSFVGAQAPQAAPVYQAGVDQSNFDQMSSPWAGIGSLVGTLGGAALGNPNIF